MSWLSLPLDSECHVTPIDDLRDHEMARTCWCRPRIDDDEPSWPIVVHNSMDRREEFERGERVPS